MKISAARVVAQVMRAEDDRALVRLEANRTTLAELRNMARAIACRGSVNEGMTVIEVMGLQVLENNLLADGVIAKVYHVEVAEREPVFRDGWSNK